MIAQAMGRLVMLAPAALAAFLLCYGAIVLLRPWLASHAVARPNMRSSHFAPVPQGGGIGVVIAALAVTAGAILLANEVENPRQTGLGAIDIGIRRNAYGRQIDSSIREGIFRGAPIEMVFIRAPKISRMGPEVKTVATEGDDPVAVAQGKTLVATFHPELSDDTTVHEYFLKLAEDKSSRIDANSGRAGSESSSSAGRTSSNSSASPSASLRSPTADPSPMRRR